MSTQYTFKELLIAANKLGECRVEDGDLNYLQMLHDQELAALRARVAELDKARWESAVRNAVKWSNGREYEWGDRAENAFAFLHAAIDAAKGQP